MLPGNRLEKPTRIVAYVLSRLDLDNLPFEGYFCPLPGKACVMQRPRRRMNYDGKGRSYIRQIQSEIITRLGMLKLTKKADYALMAMKHLADHALTESQAPARKTWPIRSASRPRPWPRFCSAW